MTKYKFSQDTSMKYYSAYINTCTANLRKLKKKTLIGVLQNGHYIHSILDNIFVSRVTCWIFYIVNAYYFISYAIFPE